MDEISQLNTRHYTDDMLKDLSFITVCVNAMIQGYYDVFYLEDMRKGFTVVELEKKHDMKIVNPATGRATPSFKYRFYADAVLKDPVGNHWLVEYKTAARMGDAYWDRLAFDHQITGNMAYLEQIYGVEFKGCIYRVMKKPGIRQTQKENKIQYLERLQSLFTEQCGDYFIEKDLFRSQEEKQAFLESLWITQKDIQNTLKTNGYYQNTGACVLKNCSYLPLCAKKTFAMEKFEQKEGR
eukprot:GHVR01072575.1.p1 GENE.GHVR01072575.1~~GHVR01072575.1.p1  ORF type:complete len:239 (+),score=23.26 GHVR01072575.1:1-717(+)